MKFKQIIQNQFKPARIKSLLFLILFPFFAQSQNDTVNINGVKYCSRDLIDIIKMEKKLMSWRMPEEFVGDTIDYKKDSSYIFIKKRKYLQMIYSSDKFKLKTLQFVNELQRKIYIENIVNNKKVELEFTETCDVVFRGVKLRKNEPPVFYFEGIFGVYKQYFSLKFDKKLTRLNFDLPSYEKCD
ncbi:hypothetical protein GKZ90_0010245 [Flavobacterium sp. MC2016-06]|uniref:hypothetical protein n=1 Tax=Flavobacterium sp. MC2016-06 TaxID=2676308 RepID=UPI0012BB147D|nr:hypothetical protein [Flavobacterium sp. MC2016-06]MBU3858480.1 hypothetical protein [Flavobacterium sp. MC2016-06]